MLFRDFDVIFSLVDVADPRELHLRARAFVEAVVAELRSRRTESPWVKLFVDIRAPGQTASFMAPFPKLGLSSAGAYVALSDSALLTTTGSAIRPLLAEAVASTRRLVREKANWDDPWFWDLIDRVGSHRGPYRQRLKSVTDRKTRVLYHLTYEWDEDGTRLYVDARSGPDDDELRGRLLVADFPGQWELATGQVPSKIHLASAGIELRDRQGLVLQVISRPG